MSYTRPYVKCKPVRSALARQRERIVEIIGEAHNQRVMIRSMHSDGRERRPAVKWVNLLPLDQQRF